MIYKNVHFVRCVRRARFAVVSLDSNVVIRVGHFQDFEQLIESKRLVSIYYYSLDLDLCFELWLLYNILIKYYNNNIYYFLLAIIIIYNKYYFFMLSVYQPSQRICGISFRYGCYVIE